MYMLIFASYSLYSLLRQSWHHGGLVAEDSLRWHRPLQTTMQTQPHLEQHGRQRRCAVHRCWATLPSNCESGVDHHIIGMDKIMHIPGERLTRAAAAVMSGSARCPQVCGHPRILLGTFKASARELSAWLRGLPLDRIRDKYTHNASTCDTACSTVSIYNPRHTMIR